MKKLIESTKKTIKSVAKKVQRTIVKDARTLPLHEREMIFRAELQKLMDKYGVGLAIATVDLDAKNLPVIEA
jgi:peptide deformylase